MAGNPVTAAQQKLNAAQERARRKKLGPVLKTTPATLDALAQVGPQDEGEIEAFVRAAAGATGVAMLRATLDTGTPPNG